MDKIQKLKELMKMKMELDSRLPAQMMPENRPISNDTSTPLMNFNIQPVEVPIMNEVPIEKMNIQAPESDQPLTHIDNEEARRVMLERLKNLPNQKLNFTGN